MTSDLSFIWTPEFVAGTLIAGLLLNVLGTYLVRLLDRLRIRFPAHFRRLRKEEALRIQRLSEAAMADTALYAALAAEASRLRVHQLLNYFAAFVFIATLLFLIAFVLGQGGGQVEMTRGLVGQGVLLIAFLVFMGGIQYSSGLEHGRLAGRLDRALREVQRNRTLPIVA